MRGILVREQKWRKKQRGKNKHTKLSPCPLFINRSIISIILSHRSSMPSHSDSNTRYCKKTLHSRLAAWTRVSLMPSRSVENTSGFSKRRMRGNKTSPKMAVHSLWSLEVSSGDSRDRVKEEKARWRTSRHGFVHCVVRAWKMGSQ